MQPLSAPTYDRAWLRAVAHARQQTHVQMPRKIAGKWPGIRCVLLTHTLVRRQLRVLSGLLALLHR